MVKEISNSIFNHRLKDIRMKFNLPRMESDKQYHFKDIIGRLSNDFSEVEVNKGDVSIQNHSVYGNLFQGAFIIYFRVL